VERAGAGGSFAQSTRAKEPIFGQCRRIELRFAARLPQTRGFFDVNNKTATAAASAVAALPAAVLGFFLVKTFLTGLGQLTTMFLGLYGVTLAACVAVVFLPFAVLIFGAKSPARKARSERPAKGGEPEAKPETGEAPVEESFEEAAPEMDAEVLEPAEDVPVSSGELEIVEPTASDADFDAAVGLDDEMSETAAFDMEDDFTFDDEEPPKKKKK
jgi:hypothetical protein